jgi:hypothetical protein
MDPSSFAGAPSSARRRAHDSVTTDDDVGAYQGMVPAPSAKQSRAREEPVPVVPTSYTNKDARPLPTGDRYARNPILKNMVEHPEDYLLLFVTTLPRLIHVTLKQACMMHEEGTFKFTPDSISGMFVHHSQLACVKIEIDPAEFGDYVCDRKDIEVSVHFTPMVNDLKAKEISIVAYSIHKRKINVLRMDAFSESGELLSWSEYKLLSLDDHELEFEKKQSYAKVVMSAADLNNIVTSLKDISHDITVAITDDQIEFEANGDEVHKCIPRRFNTRVSTDAGDAGTAISDGPTCQGDYRGCNTFVHKFLVNFTRLFEHTDKVELTLHDEFVLFLEYPIGNKVKFKYALVPRGTKEAPIDE